VLRAAAPVGFVRFHKKEQESSNSYQEVTLIKS
jgi:hypothetical protein